VWANAWGNPNNTSAVALGLTTGPAGEIVFAGNYTGTVDFGGGQLPGSGSVAAYVVKLTNAGAHVFSKGAPSNSSSYDTSGYGVGVNASGDVYLGGYFGGTIDFGGGPVTSGGNVDALFAKFSPTGASIWLQHYGTSGTQTASGLALDAAGVPYLGGVYSGSFNLGIGALPAETGGQAAFLGRLAP
jgi:hypothetical protein